VKAIWGFDSLPIVAHIVSGSVATASSPSIPTWLVYPGITILIGLALLAIDYEFRPIWTAELFFRVSYLWLLFSAGGQRDRILNLVQRHLEYAERSALVDPAQSVAHADRVVNIIRPLYDKETGSEELQIALARAYCVRANSRITQKKWRDAISELQQIKLRPPQWDYSRELGVLSALLADPEIVRRDQALFDEIIKMLDSFPKNEAVVSTLRNGLMVHMRALHEGTDWAPLASIKDDYLALFNDDNSVQSELYVYRATAKRMNADYDGAIADAERVLKRDPLNCGALLNSGLASLATDRFDVAEKHLTTVIASCKAAEDQTLAYWGRSESRLRAGDYDGATKDCTTLIDKWSKEYPLIYGTRGEAYYRLGRYEDALSDLTVAIDGGSQQGRNYFMRGESNRLQGKPKDAFADFEKAAQNSSEEYYGHYGMGFICLEQSDSVVDTIEKVEDLKRARQHFLIAEPKAKNQSEVLFVLYHRLAKVESALGNHKEAGGWLKRAVETGAAAPTTSVAGLPFSYLWDALSVSLGDPDAAPSFTNTLEQFERLAREEPNNADAHYGAGRLFLKQGGHDVEAITYFNTAIKLRSDSSDYFYVRAWAKSRSKDWLGALVDVDDAIKANDKSAANHQLRGVINNQLGHLSEAIKDFLQAIQRQPNYTDAYRDLVWTRAQNDEWEEAIKDSGKAIDEGIRNEIILAIRAEAYRMRGDLPEALRNSSEALGVAPGYALAIRIRGLTLLQQGELDTAIKDFDRAIEIDPKEALSYFGRGEARRQKSEPDKAILDLNEAIRLSDKFASAYCRRGWVQIQRWNRTAQEADLSLAAADFGEANRIEKSNPEAYCGLAEVSRFKVLLDEALAHVATALAYNPDYYFAYEIRGWVYIQKQDWEAAFRDFSKAIGAVGFAATANSYYGRAEASRMKKDWDNAISDYTDSIQRDPKVSGTYYGRGLARAAKLDSQGAISDYNDSIRIASKAGENYRHVLINRAWAYFELRCDLEAQSDVKTARDLDSKQTDVYIEWGNMLSWMGHLEDAIRMYEIVIKEGPRFGAGFAGRGATRVKKEGEINGAIEDLTAGINLGENFAYAYINRAWARLRNREGNAAIEDCLKAINLDQSISDTYNHLALGHWWTGGSVEAEENLNKVLKICLPNLALRPPRRTRGEIVSWGHYSHDWTIAVESRPTEPLAYLGRAISQWMARDLDSAVLDLHMAMELRSDFEEARRVLDLVQSEANERNASTDNRPAK